MTVAYTTKAARDGSGVSFNAAFQDQDGTGASLAAAHVLRDTTGANINPSTSDLQAAANASLSTIATAAGDVADSAYVSGSGGLIALLKGIFGKLTGTLAISGDVTAAQSVGSGSIATAQVTVASTATQIVAARTGAVGTGRIAATIFNNGSATVYLGGSGVTTAAGMVLLPGAAMTICTTAAIFGVVTSTSQSVSVLETF